MICLSIAERQEEKLKNNNRDLSMVRFVHSEIAYKVYTVFWNLE